MSIYKGLLMLEGYLTHAEHVEDMSRSRGTKASDSRTEGGRPPRVVPVPEPVTVAPGCVAGTCC